MFDGSPHVLPPKYAFAYALSKTKADTLRRFRWLQLYLGHPAIFKLLGFAAIFDEMATPPKASETVTFTGPAWVGVRHAQGTEEVEAGGGQLCEAKKFTAGSPSSSRQRLSGRISHAPGPAEAAGSSSPAATTAGAAAALASGSAAD